MRRDRPALQEVAITFESFIPRMRDRPRPTGVDSASSSFTLHAWIDCAAVPIVGEPAFTSHARIDQKH